MPRCRPSPDDSSGSSLVRQTFDPNVALLERSRLSRLANGIQRAVMVRKLQRDHGTEYVQQLIERMPRRRTTQARRISRSLRPGTRGLRNNPETSGI